MIEKIISGGQAGADLAGLIAANMDEIPTGGYAPKDYRTINGSNYVLRDKYGLTEISGGYKERTWMNVNFSDGTIRFASNFNSPGEKCTKNAIKCYGKPYFDVPLAKGYQDLNLDTIDKAVEWIKKHNIKVLNVAGNTDADVTTVVGYVSGIIYRLKLEEGTQ